MKLLQSIYWFENDLEEIGNRDELEYSQKISKVIKDYWIRHIEFIAK